MLPVCIQKAPAERPLNDVGKIHNGMKAVIEGGNQDKSANPSSPMRQMKLLSTARGSSPWNRNQRRENTHTMDNLRPRYWLTRNSTLNINAPCLMK